MTKLPPNEFINTEIGKIDNRPSWNNIPTSKLKEYIPEGKSLEEQNKIKATLREYYKRINQVAFNVAGGGGGAGILYTVPQNYTLYIDTICLNACFSGTGSAVLNVYVSNLAGAAIAELTGRSAGYNSTDKTFNNPISVQEGGILGYQMTAGGVILNGSITITGWLEDKNLNS